MKTKTNPLSAGRRHFPTLALLIATASLLAFAPQPARAGYSVPFHASCITEFKSYLQSPKYLALTVTGRGDASLMNACTATTKDELVSLIDGSASATYTLTGAHGDSITLVMVFQATDVSGGVMFAGSYTVAGGTGQFAGATGSGVLAGSALFLGENNGIGSFSLAGVLSGPGE